MKKSLVIIAITFLIVIIICVIGITMNSKKMLLQKQENNEYEQYLNNDIYGTDVVTIKIMYKRIVKENILKTMITV